MWYKFIFLLLCCLFLSHSLPANVFAYDYGDHRSVTLVTKAWKALADDDLEAVLAYTNKCLDLYAKEAQKMQISLAGFPEGDNDTVFSYWALNDVGTALYIQGKAYQNAGRNAEARSVYQRLLDEYYYAQCWDPSGKFFWKPRDAARDEILTLN